MPRHSFFKNYPNRKLVATVAKSDFVTFIQKQKVYIKPVPYMATVSFATFALQPENSQKVAEVKK